MKRLLYAVTILFISISVMASDGQGTRGREDRRIFDAEATSHSKPSELSPAELKSIQEILKLLKYQGIYMTQEQLIEVLKPKT